MLIRFLSRSCLSGLLLLVWSGVSAFGQNDSEQRDTILTLPNNLDSVKLFHVDESNDWDASNDWDGSIVQTGGLTNNRRYSISSRSYSWFDAVRCRTVPTQVFSPTVSDQRFPVIVFSHGLGGSPSRCSYLATAWASRGFVVVLVRHPGSDENVWKGKIRILNELREAYKTSWNGRTRAKDLRFVLDRLESLETDGDRLGRLLDLEKIGVGGYDLGSLAALLVAGQLPPDGGPSLADPRVKAVLAMSPPVNPPQGNYRNVYAGIAIPTFFVTGTEDDGVVGSTKAAQRRIPFDSMSGNNRFLVVLQGADHMIYGGHFLSMRSRNDQTFQQAIVRTSMLFWRAYLEADEQSLIDVTGYRLNAILGVAATVERRLAPTSGEVRSNSKPETLTPSETPSTTRPEQRESTKTSSESPLLTETFPITRLYRSMVANLEL